MSSIIDQTEDAIISRLQSQISYLKTCKSLGEFLIEEAADFTAQFPAAYVAYNGGEYSHSISGVQDRMMIFAVIVIAQSYRGDVAARHGLGAAKGAYELLNDVRSALSDQSLGLGIDPLLPLDEVNIEGTKDTAVYGIRFQTRCRFTL